MREFWPILCHRRIQITVPGGGAPKVVEPGGRVELKYVKTGSGLMEGFAYDTKVNTPPLRKTLSTKPKPPKKVEYEKVETEPKQSSKPIPPPDVKVDLDEPEPELPVKSPVDEPVEPEPVEAEETVKKEATKDDGLRRCACGKVISARNKSGKCRDCYIASLKKKE